MKNFSVNTADFDSLSISGEAPIVQSDLGTAPNQIPLNKDLGSLAYMNAPQIEDLNVDTLELREIAAEMSETAVDVFVYDTRNDSDGGKWRERTSHTSWYNEELNTATRGGRREFPAVAVIVAEAGGSTEGVSVDFTIYDGDDPDLSMWMQYRFVVGGGPNTAISALNGKIVLTAKDNGILISDFIEDSMYIHNHVARHEYFNIYPSRLGRTSVAYNTVSAYAIRDQRVNDVAMTVLPNAPIDSETGLPIPTIAVATDGGVSVIKDDGSVVDITSGGYNHIDITNNRIWVSRSDTDIIETGPFPDSDTSNASWRETSYNDSSTVPTLVGVSQAGMPVIQNYVGNNGGLTHVSEEINNLSNSMVSHATSSYNTGWMPGDIKLAALSDTKIEKVGVDETTELLVDGSGNWIGDFNVAADLDSWTESNGGIKSLNGSVIKVISGTSGDRGSVWSMIDTIPGKKYSISAQLVTVAGNGSGFISIYEGNGISGSEITTTYPNTFASGSYIYLQFTAQSEQSTIRLSGSEVLNDFTEWDNVSIKQTGELITNGTFDSGTVGWIYDDNGTSSQSVSGGVLTLSHTTYTNSMLYQILDLMPGKKYVLTGQTGGTNFDLCNIRIGSSLGGNQFGNIVSSEATSSNLIDNVITFTPTQSTTYISLRINSSSPDLSCDFDNISVRLAEEDRSVNDNGLQIFGEITKSPVAPGADLVAYSGFSEDNYLMQPYNSDLDFGTGDFSIMFWQKSTTHSGQEVFFDIGENGVFDNRYMFYRSSGTAGIQFWKRVNGVSTVILDVFDILNVGTYNFIVGTRKDGVFTFYVNGSSVGGIGDTSDLTFSGLNRTCIVGNNVNGTSPVQNMALFRISATAPTAEQIAKIYRDEKALFQDGAQATLYGTSDAVTALAYDDKTELLHVGTSSGRSDFSGLRRINNTTTAVTTSISASNNLIAEQ